MQRLTLTFLITSFGYVIVSGKVPLAKFRSSLFLKSPSISADALPQEDAVANADFGNDDKYPEPYQPESPSIWDELELPPQENPDPAPLPEIQTSPPDEQPVIADRLPSPVNTDPMFDLLKPLLAHNSTVSGGSPFQIVEKPLDSFPSGPTGLQKFTEKTANCSKMASACAKRNLDSCLLDCLLKDHPTSNLISLSVSPVVKSLCTSLGTKFEKSLLLLTANSADVETLTDYLTLVKISPDSFKRFVRLAANSIPALVLKHSNNSFKKAAAKALKLVEQDASEVKQVDDKYALINDGCNAKVVLNGAREIISALYEAPQVVEVFLPGLWTLNNIFGLIPDPLVRPNLKAYGGGLGVLTGLNCGLIMGVITKENQTCLKEERLKWKAVPEEMIPPAQGRPVVCGATPFIPVRLLGDDIFPSLFEQMPSKQPEAVPDETTPDMSWLDEIRGVFELDPINKEKDN